MLQTAGFALLLAAYLTSVTACGGGKKAAEEEQEADEDSGETTSSAPASVPAPSKVTTVTKPTVQATTTPISKGGSVDVPVSTSPTETTQPSLTLFNVDNTKLSWNDLASSSRVYQIFQRAKTGSYDETHPFQTLSDIASLTLQEIPGNWCYKIATELSGGIQLVSNEVCIKGPDFLEASDPGVQAVNANQTLQLQWTATGGSENPRFSCIESCPPGLGIQSDGHLMWTPTIAQVGTVQPKFRIESGRQSLEKNLTIHISEAPLLWAAPAPQNLVATQPFQITLTADGSGQTLQYSCISGCPQGMTLDPGTGVLSWTPLFNQAGGHTLALQARTAAQTIAQTLSLTVAEAPLHLTAPAAARLVATENLQVQLQAEAGGQTIAYSCVAACPQGFAVNSSSGAVQWTPLATMIGDHIMTLQATAGSLTQQQTLSVQVVEAFINLSLNSSGELLGEQNARIQAQSSSNLSGAASYAITQKSGVAVTLQSSASAWDFTLPNVRQPTDFIWTVTATQGAITRSEDITLHVLPNDHLPTLAAFAPQTIIASENFQLQAVAQDADGDSLEFACILDCPAGLSIDTHGLISWQPGLNQTGSHVSSLQVSANGRSVLQTLDMVVVAPQLTMTAAAISDISGATVSIQTTVQTNLHGALSGSISQSLGPVVTIGGSTGHWTFTAPAVNFPTNIAFVVTYGNGIYAKQQTFTGRIDPQPIAPTVDVGPDLIKNQSFQLSAAVSPNAQTLVWSKVSGPGTLTFSASAAATTQVTASADGNYVLRLTATNSWNQSSSDDLNLQWDTLPPVINIGADAITNTAYTRAASVTGASSLQWSKTSGPGALNFTASTAATTIIDASSDGDYLIRLTALDAAGNSSFAEFTLSFDKTVPTIDVGPAIVTNSSDVSLGANLAADVESMLWTKVSGPGAVTFTNPDQEDAAANFASDGVYVLRLTALDGFGNSARADLSVTIDRQGPVMGSIALGSAVADGYLNVSEHSNTHPLIVTPITTDLTAVTLAYKLLPVSGTCNAALTYASSIPATDDVGFTSSGTFKVCLQAKDIFNQASYASSPNIIYDTGTVSVVMSSLPTLISSSSQLSAVAGGTGVTHFKFKIGAATATTCLDSAGYSEEQDVSLNLQADLTQIPDGSVRLCVIGRNISGNWQPTSTAYQYNWTLDRLAPDQPQNFAATGLMKRIKFNWTRDLTANGYLVVRGAAGTIAWQPATGVSYTLGQTVGDDLQVVSLGTTLPAFDNNPVADTAYQYAVFGYDSAFNYGPGSQAAATASAAVAFNVAGGFDRTVRSIVQAKDGSGKYYVAGDFLIYGTKVASRLIRLNADMSMDTSFAPPAFNNVIYSLAASTDGRIYVGGAFTTFTGFTHTRLVRLNVDGSVDASFNVGSTGFSSTVQALALDESLGRLYVAGAFTTYKGLAAPRIAALKTDDASFDTTFNCGACISAPSSATVYALAVIPGQGLYLGGTFTIINTVTLNRIARLNAAGAVDTSFTTSTGTIGFDSTVYAIERDAAGSIYVGGTFGKYRGSANAYRFTRLNPTTGAIDASWPITSKFNGTVYSIRLDPDGQIYVAGDFTAFGTTTLNRLAHLSTGAVVDFSFPISGGVMNGLAANAGFPVLTLLVGSSEVLAGGAFQKYGSENTGFFLRMNRSGTLLTGSPRGTMMNSAVYAITKTGNAGEYLVGGAFTNFKGTPAFRIARMNRSGVIDTSLVNVITTTSAIVYALGVDTSTGRFYAGGTFTVPSGRLARFNSNGTADTAFNTVITTTGFNSDIYAIAHDPISGGVYVGGKFTTLKVSGMTAATTVNYLVRLLPTGYLDTSFNTGTSFNAQVNALQVLDDGTVLVGGSFTSYNGTTANRLIRLNSDGSPSNLLDIGTGFNGAVQALQYVKNEHALYVGGAFTTFRGVSSNRLAKLDDNGLSASGWALSTGLSATSYALLWDSEQEVLWVGGNFSTVRGISSPRMAGINRDGSLHSAFAPGTISLNGDVRAMAADSYGLLFGATASTYQNRVMDFLGRFLFNATLL